jgi:hypothetical protein
MRKLLATIVLLASAGIFTVHADSGVDLSDNVQKPFHVSLYAEAGLSYTTYHSTEELLKPDFSNVLGPNAGVGVNLRFLRRDKSDPAENGWLALQTGVHYDRTGFKADGTKFTLDNLCIPVELQFYPIRDLYVCAGPEFCINLGLKPKAASVMGMDIALDGHKANDLRLGFGAGYMLPSIPLGLNVKYLIGTSKFSDNLPWKGNQVRVSLCYRFGL